MSSNHSVSNFSRFEIDLDQSIIKRIILAGPTFIKSIYTCKLLENSKKYLLALCSIFSWGVWNERNNRIFKNMVGTRKLIY
jgi:hypothetical protein